MGRYGFNFSSHQTQREKVYWVNECFWWLSTWGGWSESKQCLSSHRAIYIWTVQERNAALRAHCTTSASYTLLKPCIHSPEKFSSLRSKTSQECVKTGVSISSGYNLSTTEVKNIWEWCNTKIINSHYVFPSAHPARLCGGCQLCSFHTIHTQVQGPETALTCAKLDYNSPWWWGISNGKSRLWRKELCDNTALMGPLMGPPLGVNTRRNSNNQIGICSWKAASTGKE